jgi:hypothetical protein
LYSLGFRVWLVYTGGPSAAHQWSKAEIAVPIDAGFHVYPVWVPRLGLDGDPAADAAQGIVDTQARGLSGVIFWDTERQDSDRPTRNVYLDGLHSEMVSVRWVDGVYSGAGYCPLGALNLRPAWGDMPTVIPEGLFGVQWSGPTTICGLEVDRSILVNELPVINYIDAPDHLPPSLDPTADHPLGACNVQLPILDLNVTGADGAVKAIQTLVNGHGDSLAVDGVYGPRTFAAVRNFQASHALEVDGVIGVHTWGALLGTPQ